jgi:hypothetical protein
MERVLTLSETLYTRLDRIAQRRGLTVEQLLDVWQRSEDASGAENARQISDLQDYLFRKYGEMADSTALIRADRER